MKTNLQTLICWNILQSERDIFTEDACPFLKAKECLLISLVICTLIHIWSLPLPYGANSQFSDLWCQGNSILISVGFSFSDFNFSLKFHGKKWIMVVNCCYTEYLGCNCYKLVQVWSQNMKIFFSRCWNDLELSAIFVL